jgi:hypothetical protein
VRRPYIVLTLGSPPEKGRKKKTLVPIWGFQDLDFQDLDRQKKKKTLVLTRTARRKRAEKKNHGPDLGFRTSTFKT